MENPQWPKALLHKMVEHYYNRPIPVETAEAMGMYENMAHWLTKRMMKEHEKNINQGQVQEQTGQPSQLGTLQQQPVQASGQPMSDDGVLRSAEALPKRGVGGGGTLSEGS
jgi:hypothetical protein